MEEIWDSITTYLKDRSSTPLTGALVLSWAAWNHRIFFVLFSDLKVGEKFHFIDEALYPTWKEVLGRGVAFPLASACFYLFVYHWPALWSYRLRLWQQARMLAAKRSSEKSRIRTVADFERLEARYEAEISKEIHRANVARDRVEMLEKSLASQVEKGRKNDARVVELEAASMPLNLDSRSAPMERLLLSNNWTHHNPVGAARPVTFGENGRILTGQTSDFYRWEVSHGRLCIESSTETARCIYDYDANRHSFMMDDSASSTSITGQFISLVDWV